jgi:intracellular multiplication protein IcmL
MNDNELYEITLQDDFYRDSFTKVVLIIISVVVGIILTIAMSCYLYLNKPSPKYFHVGEGFRIVAPIPIDQPSLRDPELLQWVSNVISKVFTFDFNHYDVQLAQAKPYFTPDGWQNFLNQLNIYANSNKVQSGKMFISGVPSGAPIILNDSSTGGLVSGRYAWLVQIPVDINYAYAGNVLISPQTLTLKIMVVRVLDIDNLDGVAIENVEVEKNPESR